MYKNKRVGIIGIIITIVILIILIILTNININSFSHSENLFSKLVMPISNSITYLKNKIKGNTSFFQNIEEIKAENEKLKAENSKLAENLRELEIIKAENVKLREYSNMTDKYIQYTTIPADVINKDISNLSSTIIINVGTDDGVYSNMPVIASEGLVGHIISATNNTAKVQPIIDPASSVSAIISTSRDNVILKGILNNSDKLKVTYIPTYSNLILEDTIETSGIGGIYPKGILIGKLKEIIETKNITDRYAMLETAVDFSKLETVLVITK